MDYVQATYLRPQRKHIEKLEVFALLMFETVEGVSWKYSSVFVPEKDNF